MGAVSERWRSVGLVSYPAGAERELLFQEHAGAARLLTPEDGDLLSLCRAFRGTEEHARAICREAGLPDGEAPALALRLDELAREGLLVSRSELLRLLEHAPAEAAPPLRAAALRSGHGAALNELLRAHRGERVLVDPAPVRGMSAARVSFRSDAPPLLTGTPEGPARDPSEAHARALGASPAALAAPDVDLDRLDAAFLRRLRRKDGFVAASFHGTRAGFVAETVLTNRPAALGGPMGLDLRRPLPPAPEIDAGALDVFLLALRKTWDAALVALLPGAIDAAPPPRPPGLADLMLALIAPLDLGPVVPPGPARFPALAAHLRAAAELSSLELRALLAALLARPDVDVPRGLPDALRAYAARLDAPA